MQDVDFYQKNKRMLVKLTSLLGILQLTFYNCPKLIFSSNHSVKSVTFLMLMAP